MAKYQTVWVNKKTRLLLENLQIKAHESRTQLASQAVKVYGIDVYRAYPDWNQVDDDYIQIGPTERGGTRKGRKKSSRRNYSVNLDKKATEIARRITQVTPWTMPRVVEDSVAHYFILVTVSKGLSVEEAEHIYNNIKA